MTNQTRHDAQCLKILMVLNRKPSGVRYTELEKVLNSIGAGFTRPTLLNHLRNHLVKEDIVKRTVDEETRNTTYKINYDKFTNSRKDVERMDKMIKNYNENIKYLLSLPIEDQMNEIKVMMVYRDLNKLKALIEYMSDKTNFDKGYTYLLWNDPTFENYELVVASKCLEDEKYKEEILENIDAFLNLVPN